MEYSQTQSGNLLVVGAVISMLLGKFGITLVPDEVVMLLTAIGVCLSWYGRYKQGDVTFGGFKKN